MEKEKDLGKVVETMLDKCMAPDTSTGLGCDNMSAIIVDLRKLTKTKK